MFRVKTTMLSVNGAAGLYRPKVTVGFWTFHESQPDNLVYPNQKKVNFPN